MQKENEKPLAWKPLLKIQMIETILSINSITLEPLIIGLLFEKQQLMFDNNSVYFQLIGYYYSTMDTWSYFYTWGRTEYYNYGCYIPRLTSYYLSTVFGYTQQGDPMIYVKRQNNSLIWYCRGNANSQWNESGCIYYYIFF